MAELGLDGVWSCIYCEGTWLNFKEVTDLIDGSAVPVANWPVLRGHANTAPDELVCPSCDARSFVELGAATGTACCCRSCRGIFFRKGVLLSLVPSIGNGTSGPELLGKTIASVAAWLVTSVVLS